MGSYQRGRGIKEIQAQESSLTFGPALQTFEELSALPAIAKRDGQVRLVIADEQLYKWDAAESEWLPFRPRELEGVRKIDVVAINDPAELAQAKPTRTREVVLASDGSSSRLYFWAIGQRPIAVAYPFIVSEDPTQGSWVSFEGASSAMSHFSMVSDGNYGLVYEGTADPGVILQGVMQLERDVTTPVTMTPVGHVPILHNDVEYQIMLWEPEPVNVVGSDETSIPPSIVVYQTSTSALGDVFFMDEL